MKKQQTATSAATHIENLRGRGAHPAPRLRRRGGPRGGAALLAGAIYYLI